jgi:rRNA-processing protein FCF1
MWLNIEDFIYAELERLTRRLRAAKRKKQKRVSAKLQKRINELHQKLNEIEGS